jgi:hypothetical protein
MQALAFLDTRVLNHALKGALRRAGPTKTINAHPCRSGFPTHRLQRGPDIHTMQPLLGYDDLTIQQGVSRIATYMLPSIRGQIGGWEGTCSLLKTVDLQGVSPRLRPQCLASRRHWYRLSALHASILGPSLRLGSARGN